MRSKLVTCMQRASQSALDLLLRLKGLKTTSPPLRGSKTGKIAPSADYPLLSSRLRVFPRG